MKKLNTKKLTVFAIMIALSTVLSLVKLWEMPLGGAITLLSMLPICMVAIIYGVKSGFACAFVYSLTQLGLAIGAVVGWGLTPLALVGTIVFDYILPFTLLGIAGAFYKDKKWQALLGIVVAMALRFVCHFISGVIIFDIWCPWANVYTYSLAYNGGYMLPELVLTVAGAYFLLSSGAVKKLIQTQN